MPSKTTGAGVDPIGNLQVVLGIAGLLYFGWTWGNFSGPLRFFVDVQLRLFGTYSELAAVIASAIAITGVIVPTSLFMRWSYPSLSASAADSVVAVVFVSASAIALWQAWHLWNETAHMPRLSDPVQVVDLSLSGAFPVGHVRVIGTPDRRRQVLFHSASGRRARSSSYWETWVPLASRQPDDLNAPVRIVATSRDPDRTVAMKAVPDNPEGVLLFDSVDTRTLYELRREGLGINEHPFALYSDEGVRFERFTNAGLLGSFIVLCWGVAAYRWIEERKSGNTTTGWLSTSATKIEQAPIVAAPDTTASLATPLAPTSEALATRVGTAAGVASLLMGCLLWEVFGFPITRVQLLAYVAVGLMVGVALLLMWLGQRREEATPEVARLPTGDATTEATIQPAGAAMLYVLRDEPGFGSTSYKRVDVDGKRVADLKSNQYTAIPLRSGMHTLAVNTRLSLTHDTVARFEVAPNDIVAYRLQIPFFGPMRLERTLDIPEVRTALKRLRLVESS